MFLKEKAAAVLTIDEVKNRVNELVADTDKFDVVCRFFSTLEDEPRTLDETFAQDIVAQQLGFDDHADLMSLLKHETLATDQAEVLLVFSAFLGHDENVASMLDAKPELAQESVVSPLLLADAQCLRGVSAQNVNELVGPLQATRICYLLNSCYRQLDKALQQQRIDLANELIQLGANLDVGIHETDSIRGFKTLLGSAIDCVGNADLVQLLLDSGAPIDDGPTLYEGCAMWYAVRAQKLDCLQTLIAAEPPLWHLCHALTHAIDYHHVEMVRCLLEAGADPDWNQTIRGFKGSALHEALVASAPAEILELLLDKNANLEVADRIGRTPLGVAVAMGNERAISLLEQRGASQDAVRPEDRWVGQRASDTRAEQATQAGDSGEFQLEDHLWIHEAIRREEYELARRLIEDGLNPFAVDYTGNTALHLAVANGQFELCKLMVDLDKELDTPNFEGETALSMCYAHSTPFNRSIEQCLRLAYEDSSLAEGACLFSLSRAEKFEQAADAICNGELEKLEQILLERPELAQARSIRPHRCALITYVGVNGFEGERQKTPLNIVDIIDLLLSKGCDPSSVCFTYRGGPGENAIGLLTSSGIPPVELQLPMVHALVQGGAWVNPGTRYLVDLYNAFLNHELAQFLAQDTASKQASVDALIQAIYMKQTALAEALLDSDIDVNAPTESNVRAIHQAAYNGDRALVDLLLLKGANPTLQDSRFNGNAAGWAFANDHEELGQYLEGVIKEFEEP